LYDNNLNKAKKEDPSLSKSPSKRKRMKGNQLEKENDMLVILSTTHPSQCQWNKILAEITSANMKESKIK
jgi:CRISPR/Cas system CSM-associated protein Csm2 small subunit